MLADLPLVLGHEVAGVVSDIGPDVAGFELGDRIAAFGYPQHSPGYSVDGGFADKYLAEAEGLMKLPDAVDFVHAATATDAGQTAHAPSWVRERCARTSASASLYSADSDSLEHKSLVCARFSRTQANWRGLISP